MILREPNVSLLMFLNSDLDRYKYFIRMKYIDCAWIVILF